MIFGDNKGMQQCELHFYFCARKQPWLRVHEQTRIGDGVFSACGDGRVELFTCSN